MLVCLHPLVGRSFPKGFVLHLRCLILEKVSCAALDRNKEKASTNLAVSEVEAGRALKSTSNQSSEPCEVVQYP